jgi:glycosyltransferase involved in cell wall biosynthesis
MKFSIVIPTYNRADFIDKTINSLLKQSYINFEIIVVDDGSTDNTEDIVKNISDSRLFYFKKENAERGAARNYGAFKATGDFINFFDSDDIAYNNHLNVALETINNNIDVNVFHLGYDIKLVNGTQGRIPSKITDINKQLAKGNFLSCNGVFVKREIALKNPFNENRDLSASEDYLLWLQLAAQYPIVNNNTITSTIIDHDERSVVSINKSGLIKRKELMLKLALEDRRINSYYKKNIKNLKSNTYSYISLHLILAKEKKEGVKFLKKSIHTDISFIFSKRFLGIIKNLITF